MYDPCPARFFMLHSVMWQRELTDRDGSALEVTDMTEDGSNPPAPGRRAEDAAVILFGGDRHARGSVTGLDQLHPTPAQLAHSAFLIELDGEDALVVPGADAHVVPRGDGGEELQQRAGAMAQALRRERDRLERRLRMPDFLLAYAESLLEARSPEEAYQALREVVVPVVGAYTAVVFFYAGDAPDARFVPLADPAPRLQLPDLPGDSVTYFIEPQVVTRAEIAADRTGVLAPFTAVMDAAGAAQLLVAPVGTDALLVLIERRRDRVLAGDERDLLSALVRQAESAVGRLASERQVASYALTDPVTGLPSGRHVEIIVDHALAMARRGHPLTLMLVDLAAGASAGDAAEDALYGLAACLREELRGTDLAMRQGADRFLVLLADTDENGAQAVMRRLEGSVEGVAELRAGIAVYGAEQDTAERLAAAAAVALKRASDV